MHITILGASGSVGGHLVHQAVHSGHTVRAVARPTSSLDVPAGVDVVRGSLDDLDFLTGAFTGADGVLGAVGLRMRGYAPWSTPEDPTLLSRTVPRWIEAMHRAGVPRIVAVSAAGVGDSARAVGLAFRAAIRLTALRFAYAELDALERALHASDVEACTPRPTLLTDAPRTDAVVEAEKVSGTASIPRADVAAWMLQALGRDELPRAPMLTVTGAR